MRILVSDGEERASLAVVRALGRRGHEVTVLSSDGRSLAGSSRHAHRDLAVPSACDEPDAFLEAVVESAVTYGVDVVLPIGEPAALAVLAARERLRPRTIPFPALATFRAICDKPRVLSAARGLGIAVPEQREAATPRDLALLAGEIRTFPVVVKPGRSTGGSAGRWVKLGVSHAADASALRALADRLPEEAYPVLVQQRIIGPGTGVFLLLWDGVVRARFAHRRVREKPPAGGVSVLSESVALEAELEARSVELLRAFEWQGVAMVEYKRDAASGTPYLMEVNGRFWGSLQLAIDAGVDFPSLLLACAAGEAPEPPPYRVGQRLRWFWGDVDHLLTRLRRSEAELALPPGSPGRARTALDFVLSWRPGQRSEPWRLSDPFPFLCETRRRVLGVPGRRSRAT